MVSRHQYGPVDHQEIGVCGRKPLPVFVENGFRHGQGDEPVGFVLKRAERAKLFFHACECLVVLVRTVLAFHVSDGLVGAETGQSVYMAVRVVAGQIAVVEPQYPLDMQERFEPFFDVGAVQAVVTVGRKQTFRSGQERAVAVAFDGTAFEYEVQMVRVRPVQYALLHQASVDTVVLVGGELLSPSVETEIQKERAGFVYQGNKSMIACPRVVGRAIRPSYLRESLCRKFLFQQGLYFGALRSHY